MKGGAGMAEAVLPADGAAPTNGAVSGAVNGGHGDGHDDGAEHLEVELAYGAVAVGGRPSPLTAADVAATRRPTAAASTLPRAAYHDPAILAYELESWYADGWVCVGREEDIPLSGSYLLVKLCGEDLIVVRDKDLTVRGFFNFCRHRGSTLLEEPTGRVPRIQCPYHAWVYGLDGKLSQPRHTELLEGFDLDEYGLVPVALDTWQGFVFVNISGEAGPLAASLGDMPDYFGRYDLAGLRRAAVIDYDVKANWKAIVENYSECYHCPGVHPQLNKITPYNLGDWIPTDGPWSASWMPVVGEHDTLTLDGQLHGRALLAGTTEEDLKKIYYFVVWPNLLISLHPDYLMTHRIVPVAPDRSLIACEWFFEAESMADPGFDPSDAIGFWDLTNRQDWAVCELQQAGTASRAYTPGRYTGMESGPHKFDVHVADRYANDGVLTPLNRISKAEGSGGLASRAKMAVRG